MKTVIRVLISPILLVISYFVCGLFTLFPLTGLFFFFNLLLFCLYPFILAYNSVASESSKLKIQGDCAFMELPGPVWCKLLLTGILPIWFPFYSINKFIKTGEFQLLF